MTLNEVHFDNFHDHRRELRRQNFKWQIYGVVFQFVTQFRIWAKHKSNWNVWKFQTNLCWFVFTNLFALASQTKSLHSKMCNYFMSANAAGNYYVWRVPVSGYAEVTLPHSALECMLWWLIVKRKTKAFHFPHQRLSSFPSSLFQRETFWFRKLRAHHHYVWWILSSARSEFDE